jgi:hypothetical protein
MSDPAPIACHTTPLAVCRGLWKEEEGKELEKIIFNMVIT